jgi:hypothetical protein
MMRVRWMLKAGGRLRDRGLAKKDVRRRRRRRRRRRSIAFKSVLLVMVEVGMDIRDGRDGIQGLEVMVEERIMGTNAKGMRRMIVWRGEMYRGPVHDDIDSSVEIVVLVIRS